jgi:hypothetical protein
MGFLHCRIPADGPGTGRVSQGTGMEREDAMDLVSRGVEQVVAEGGALGAGGIGRGMHFQRMGMLSSTNTTFPCWKDDSSAEANIMP